MGFAVYSQRVFVDNEFAQEILKCPFCCRCCKGQRFLLRNKLLQQTVDNSVYMLIKDTIILLKNCLKDRVFQLKNGLKQGFLEKDTKIKYLPLLFI